MIHLAQLLTGMSHAACTFAAFIMIACTISITLSLRTLAAPPETSEINQLLSVGFTLRDPEGRLVDRFDD